MAKKFVAGLLSWGPAIVVLIVTIQILRANPSYNTYVGAMGAALAVIAVHGGVLIVRKRLRRHQPLPSTLREFLLDKELTGVVGEPNPWIKGAVRLDMVEVLGKKVSLDESQKITLGKVQTCPLAEWPDGQALTLWVLREQEKKDHWLYLILLSDQSERVIEGSYAIGRNDSSTLALREAVKDMEDNWTKVWVARS